MPATQPQKPAVPAPLTYKYIFSMPKGEKKEFTVQLQPQTLDLIRPKQQDFPEWTALAHRKCSNCPLKEEQTPHCPAATSLVEVMQIFGSAISYDTVKIRVESQERAYEKELPLQKGLSGLMGLLMVSSGCPILGRLRPLIRYHLPFSDLNETQYRILSMYLLAQHLRSRKGKDADWKLEKLGDFYKEIQQVNSSFMKRLLTTSTGDASPNALVILNAFADAITFSVKGMMLDDLDKMFEGLLE